MRSGVSDTASRPLIGATSAQALTRFVEHAFRLRGRASRSEYWWWMLVNVIVLVVFQLTIPAAFGSSALTSIMVGPFGSLLFADIGLLNLGPMTGDAPFPAVLSTFVAGAWLLLTLVPGFTVAVRRLHDSNLSGWWALMAFVPFGQFVLLMMQIRRSRPEGARFD